MPERWDEELKAAGFGGVDTVLYDHKEPYQMNANILASAAERSIAPTTKTVTVVHNGPLSPSAQDLRSAFLKKGIEVDLHDLMSADVASLPADQDIISVLALDKPFIDDISTKQFDKLMDTIPAIKAKNCMLWLTHAAQMDCKDPRFAKIIGLARNARSELGIDHGHCRG